MQPKYFLSMEEVICPVEYPLPLCSLVPRQVQEGWRGQVWVERSLWEPLKLLLVRAELHHSWKVELESQHRLCFAAPWERVQAQFNKFNSIHHTFFDTRTHAHLFWISSALFCLAWNLCWWSVFCCLRSSAAEMDWIDDPESSVLNTEQEPWKLRLTYLQDLKYLSSNTCAGKSSVPQGTGFG